MEAKLKNQIMTYFKISGYQIRSDVAMLLVVKMKDLPETEWQVMIDKIFTNIQNQPMESTNIEDTNMTAAIRECSSRHFEESETIFSIINAFEVPSFKYQREKKKFVIESNKRNILASALSRSEYIKNRYETILQRLLRHELFSPNVNENIRTGNENIKKFNLKYSENLLSSSSVKEVVMLGLLSKLKEGKFCIEDPSGAIPIDLSEAKFHSGLFTEGAFVLAEGSYNDGVMKVSGLGFPPPEPASSSRPFYGTQNYWGGPSRSLLKYSKRLLDYERLNFGGTIAFLSDCWLDDANVLIGLKKLFRGFDEAPPVAIVMMGPFLKNKENLSQLRSKFAQLGDAIDSTLTLKHETDIVLVPDCEDPVTLSILPRFPIQHFYVQDLMKKCKRVICATNPCRLQYCTQQIVVFRYDLMKKLCRNTIKFPDDGELADHFVRTLICQNNLTPFTQIVLPTYWDFDASLSLYPLPDLIVMGDSSNEFSKTHGECHIINTGSFPKSNFSFKLYMPASKTVEDSQIPDDDEENSEMIS